MTSSAEVLIAAAPIGALVTYSDGRPRPPTRFKRQLAEWLRFNGVGRLDSVTDAEMRGAHQVPARFVLHVGDFGSSGTIVLTVRMCFVSRSQLTFDVVQAGPGDFVGFITDGVHLEVGAVVPTEEDANAWLAQPRADRAFVAKILPDRSLRRLPPALVAVAA